jgi:hypothetical protein
MKRRDLIFVLIVVAVVSGLIYLSVTGKHPQPTSQSIAQHQGFDFRTPRTKCLECHDPVTGTGTRKIKETHPAKWKDEKFSCLGCHKLQPAGDPAKAGLAKGAPAQ